MDNDVPQGKIALGPVRHIVGTLVECLTFVEFFSKIVGSLIIERYMPLYDVYLS